LADKGIWKLTADADRRLCVIYTPQQELANPPMVTYRIHTDGPAGVSVMGSFITANILSGCSADVTCRGTQLEIRTITEGGEASGTFELVSFS
jgi:hypothetical protein